MSDSETLPSVNPDSKNGIIVLADISGFTRFVQTIDPQQGVEITRSLLASIISHNKLGLTLSEIEGDAVLFYKNGIPPSYGEVIQQFKLMTSGFHKRWQYYRRKFNIPYKMELKLIIHYGEFSTYCLNGFTKLYGYSVIQAHRLLKNSVMSNRYLLITEDYLSAIGYSSHYPYSGLTQCELYSDIGKICYNYLPEQTALVSTHNF